MHRAELANTVARRSTAHGKPARFLPLPHAFRALDAQSGVALLISLFALLLICVVGVALIMASGTDSALTGNYHSATSVYYSALAGLEEGRGRMLPRSPNYLNTFVAPPGALLPPGQVRYILNPFPGETVAPWDQSTTTTFPDTEYAQEFGAPPPTSAPAMQSTNSIYTPPTTQVLPGPNYKWVRINAITIASAQTAFGVNVNPGFGTSTTPLFYDGNRLDVELNGVQALEITALAAMPNGSQRMLQYVVAPITLNFPAALTLDGANVTFTPPASNTFVVSGIDTTPCTPGPANGAAGIGYPNTNVSPDQSLANINAGIAAATSPAGGYPANFTGNYTGIVTAPNVLAVALPPNLQTPASLNGLVYNIAQKADVVVSGPTDQSIIPAGMSAANPMIIVVNGDLTLNSLPTNIGYGVLVVTGTLTYNSSISWLGVVLVIGKGQLVSTGPGAGIFQGATLVANTLAPDGTTLPALGPASSTQAGGNGFVYSSCWINTLNPIAYKILSFREIPQTGP